MLHYRGGRKMMNPGIYRDVDSFYAHVGAAYNKAVHAFYDAGCRYLQLDDISFAYLCDPEQRDTPRPGSARINRLNERLRHRAMVLRTWPRHEESAGNEAGLRGLKHEKARELRRPSWVSPVRRPARVHSDE